MEKVSEDSFLDENKPADIEPSEKIEHATDVMISLWILKDTFYHYLKQNQLTKGLSKSGSRFFIRISGKKETTERNYVPGQYWMGSFWI